MRFGIGYDIHRLVKDRPCILGGVTIPHEKGLKGHSDADVLLHAITDALLGAAALGDIGQHFPDTDPKNKDISSEKILRSIMQMVRQRGFEVNNIDATVIAEKPKLQEFIPAIIGNIAQILEIPASGISVKATTHEGLGSLGRGEGIATMAVVSIQKSKS